MSIRFSPDACPGCGSPLRPKYSTYRIGARHWLFPAALVGGMLATLALIPVILWGVGQLAEFLLGDLGLQRREMGVLYFFLLIPFGVAVWRLNMIGWRVIHRLPRNFTAGCETCTWTGPCKVYETDAEL